MTGLELDVLDDAAALRWEAALRLGRRVRWTGAVPRGWHPAELGPLAECCRPDVQPFAPPQGGGDGPAVTAVIPTHRRVPAGLWSLRSQAWPTRILVVSNGVGPERVAGARVWRTPWTGHADTRRRALAEVDTPLVLMMSDDAVPLGTGFVDRLVRRLRHSGADAVVARQVPWPTALPATRLALRRWTPPTGGPMPHADHVATLYRTDTLRSLATVDVPIAEDLAWTHGRTVMCAADAPVLHSHPPDLVADFRRRRAEHAVRAKLGMHLPIPGLRAALQAVPGACLAADTPADLVRRWADLAGMALGARAGRPSG